MKNTSTLIAAPLLAALMFAPGVCSAGQPVLFDEIYGRASISGMLAERSRAMPSPEAAVEKDLNGSAPELAYEDLLRAPLWKAAAQAGAAASDLKNGFGPARHQGGRNLCNSFAASALAEYLIWEKEGLKPDLSEEFLYYNTKLNFTDTPDLHLYKAESGMPGYAAVLGLAAGVAPEQEWPLLAALPPHAAVPPLTDPDLGTPPAGIAQKLLAYKFAPQAVRRGEIKQFLAAENRPVVMNLMFYVGNIDGVTGRLRQPTDAQRQACFSSGQGCGGHVVLLTGYDPQSKEYLFRNSWGAGWGDKGYGRVPEAYVEQDCESCHYIPGLAGHNAGNRTLVVNAAYGWSATLE